MPDSTRSHRIHPAPGLQTIFARRHASRKPVSRGVQLLQVGRDDGAGKGSHVQERPKVEITYCRQCRWLLRATWMAQELLTTFEDEIGSVVLTPGTGGVFTVQADGQLIWSRKDAGRFPESPNSSGSSVIRSRRQRRSGT